MEDLTYYSAECLILANLADLAKTIGYHTSFQEIMGARELIIYFDDERTNFTIWTHPPGSVSIAKRRLLRLEKAGIVPQTVFWVRFYTAKVDVLIGFLKDVMAKHGGLVEIALTYDMYRLDGLEQVTNLYSQR